MLQSGSSSSPLRVCVHVCGCGCGNESISRYIAAIVTDMLKNVFFKVETLTHEEVKEVLQYASQTKTSLTRIMLDNMVVPLPNGDVDVSMLKEAVELINEKFEMEASHDFIM